LDPGGNIRLAATLLSLLLTGPVHGAGKETAAWSSGWTLAPYGWLAGFDGDFALTRRSAQNGTTSGVGRAAGLALEESEKLGFMTYAEWRGERWMMSMDVVWARVSQGAALTLGSLLPSSGLEASVDATVYQASAGYRLAGTDRTAVVAYMGLRHYDVDVEARASTELLQSAAVAAGSRGWTDVVGGIRLSYAPAGNWRVTLVADAGAGESDTSWQAFALVGYRYAGVSLQAGYRVMEVDYETAGFGADLRLTGPMAGLAFHF